MRSQNYIPIRRQAAIHRAINTERAAGKFTGEPCASPTLKVRQAPPEHLRYSGKFQEAHELLIQSRSPPQCNTGGLARYNLSTRSEVHVVLWVELALVVEVVLWFIGSWVGHRFRVPDFQ